MTHSKVAVAGLLLAFALCTNCARNSTAREERYLAMGQRYMDKKDYSRAILEYKNATQVAPASAEAHYRLGLAFLEAGDVRSGVQYLMKCTELDPRHVGGQAKLAQLMATSRNPEVLAEARKRAQAAFNADPKDAAALDAIALMEWNSAKPQEAEQHLREALKNLPGDLKSAVLLANMKLAVKDYAAAEDVLRKAAAASPDTTEPHIALGSLFQFLKRSAEAEQQFQEALRIKPDCAPAMLELARELVLSGKKNEAEEMYKRISALPDKVYRPAYALFLLYLVDAKRGTIELESLYQKDPANLDLRRRLIAAYFSQHRLADAQTVLDRDLGKNPKDVVALLQRGELFTQMGRYTEAERDLNHALQTEPNLAAAHAALAQVFAARGEAPRQRQELAEALRLNPDSLGVRLALVNEHLRANSTKAALDVLSQTPDSQRQRLEYLASRNWALLKSGDVTEARKGIDASLAISNAPDFILQDATLRLQQKDFVGARKSLEIVLTKNPTHVGALQMLVESYSASNQLSTGISRLISHASTQPASAPVQMLLATWLRRTGNLAGARKAAEAAKAASPSSIVPDLMVTELDLMENRLDAARRRLQELPEKSRSTPEARMLFAELERQAGNYPGAIEHLRAIVSVSPRSVVALNNLAYLLVDYANKPDEALQYAQLVKELAPNDPTVDDTIGWAFFNKGLYPTAVSYLQKAANRSSRSAVCRYHLAMAYFKSGDRINARHTLAAALQLDPKVPEAKRAKELIAGTPLNP